MATKIKAISHQINIVSLKPLGYIHTQSEWIEHLQRSVSTKISGYTLPEGTPSGTIERVANFIVEPDGTISSVTLTTGSGAQSHDEVGSRLIQRIRNTQMPPFAPDMKRKAYSFSFPIRIITD